MPILEKKEKISNKMGTWAGEMPVQEPVSLLRGEQLQEFLRERAE